MQANVLDFGAVPDGQTLDTAAIQAALDACAPAGGTVYIPAGRYLSGSVFLHSNTTLHLEAGAILLGSQDPEDYPIIPGRWEGVQQEVHAPLIAGHGLTTIAVTGRGIIDGQGALWWELFREKRLLYPRPRLLSFTECKNVLIEGITAINSPSWTITPVCCENVTIDKVTVANPPDSPNTDGINPDSCCNVHISNCHVDVGDDCITIKSGTEAIPLQERRPCENLTITNCTMLHGHGGVVIGSETSGDVRNVVISNCVFIGTDRGIRLKSRRGRGGVVEDIRVNNVIMEKVLCPFAMNLYYACGRWGDPVISDKEPQPITDSTPRFRRVTLSHLTAQDAQIAAGFVYGLAEMPVEDLALNDISISLDSQAEPGYPDMADGLELMQRAGLFLRNVHGLRLEHVEITGQSGPAFWIQDAAQVEISRCTTPTPGTQTPVIHLENVKGGFVHGCWAAPETNMFLHLSGEHSQGICTANNALENAAIPTHIDTGVPKNAIHPL
ncbi:MAG: glycoside hydrolase family 28 protein [Chloroflexota bacterium]